MGGNNSAIFGKHKSLTGLDYLTLAGLGLAGGGAAGLGPMAGLFGGGMGGTAAGASLAGANALAPLTAAEIGDVGLLGSSGSMFGGLAGGLGGGAADELLATSSGIGAAGAPASPSSIAFGNFMTQYGKPALGALGQAGKIYGAGNALGGAAAVPGFGAEQQSPLQPAPLPPPPPPQAPSAQALGAQFGLSQPPAPGGSAAMVANRMSGPGSGGMSPQMMQALMMLLSRGGGIQ